MGAGAARSTGGYGALEATSGLDQLKNRVVFTYGFMEMMFWLWVSLVRLLATLVVKAFIELC
jgi:hypothetical protein